MEPVRIGVVGVGGMGGAHCKVLDELEESALVAVADVNEEVARSVGETYSAQPFTDYKDMIDNGGIDAVAIVTPHFFHPPIAEYAASKGVHVLSEKPIAVTVKAAQRMVDACRESGVLLGVMFQQRLVPWRKKMRDMVQSGELGDLFRVTMTAPWYRTQAYYDSGAWRGTWKGEGGGVLMNQAPHSLDQFLWIGGAPKSIQAIATTRLHDIEVENTVLAICDYGNGKVGSFYVSTAEAGTEETMEVIGDKGGLVWDGKKLTRFEVSPSISEHLKGAAERFGQMETTRSEIELEAGPEGAHKEVHRAFANAMRHNDPSLMVATGEDGVRALEFANAMLMAGYTHREVQLPVDPEAVEAMLEKLQGGAKPEDFRLQ